MIKTKSPKRLTYLASLKATPYTAKDEAALVPVERMAQQMADSVGGTDDALWNRTYHDTLVAGKYALGLYSYDPSCQNQLPLRGDV